MNLSATILLAFGMSMDAFAASIGKGATLHKPKFSEAVRTGLIFGVIETPNQRSLRDFRRHPRRCVWPYIA